MNINFECILFYAVCVTGLICLVDVLFFSKKRRKRLAASCRLVLTETERLPILVDYARSFFPVLLAVFLLRSFFFEPYRIPSGSLEPTLWIGDFVLVNKFDYGIRLPLLHKKIISFHEPQRGDIIVFRWPPKPSVNFIKRVIGLPGDHIRYVNKILYINGKMMSQRDLNQAQVSSLLQENPDAFQDALTGFAVIQKKENLFGRIHSINIQPMQSSNNDLDLIVPDKMYFVMGDNRDDSADSRYWGFVPEQNIVGKAITIWMSWDSIRHTVRWHRLMKRII